MQDPIRDIVHQRRNVALKGWWGVGTGVSNLVPVLGIVKLLKIVLFLTIVDRL